MMPRHLKGTACLTGVLAVGVYLFFQLSKHQAVMAQVNPFAEDPYDAVGSFGVQLALLTALLSVVRAFRPYQAKQGRDPQQWLLVRAASLSCLSVAVTVVADGVAMLRSPSLWMGFSAGYILVALLGGMVLLTALVGWRLFPSARMIRVPSSPTRWTRALGLSLVGLLILAFYPDRWRQSVPGALLTVLVGMVLFFGAVWAWGMVVAPPLQTPFEDTIDDLAAIYWWLKAHSGPLVVVSDRVEQVLDWPVVRPLLCWLNPRQHPWHGVIVLGVLLGGGLLLTEMLSEGGPPELGRLALVATIFVSVEAVGVVLGYALLASPLGLFRHDEQV